LGDRLPARSLGELAECSAACCCEPFPKQFAQIYVCGILMSANRTLISGLFPSSRRSCRRAPAMGVNLPARIPTRTSSVKMPLSAGRDALDATHGAIPILDSEAARQPTLLDLKLYIVQDRLARNDYSTLLPPSYPRV
jgi:hypothetical protein